MDHTRQLPRGNLADATADDPSEACMRACCKLSFLELYLVNRGQSWSACSLD
jgi:hypothetical protein